jgi:hypothetical protein
MRRTGSIILVLILLAANGPSQGAVGGSGQAVAQAVRLSLGRIAAQTSVPQLRLLPDPQSLTDGDAYPYYQAAMKALPENLNRLDQIPLDQFSATEAGPTVKELAPVLTELYKATQCRTCNWPEVKQGSAPEGVKEFGQFAYILASQARYHLAKGEYAEAAKVISAGLVVARHLGQAPNLTRQLVGVAVGQVVCREVEQWIQCAGSPSLFEAIKALPRPFIDPNEQIQREVQAVRSNPKFLFAQGMAENVLKPAHDRARLTCLRLDRQIAALQDVEAIRLYVSQHGTLPGALSDTGLLTPNDPLTQRPLIYTAKSGTAALLEGKPPEAGSERDALRYELSLVKGP